MWVGVQLRLSFTGAMRLLVGLCAVLALGVSPAIFAEDKPRPNIVFILADDLGFTDLASYGSEIATPTLSALAEAGIQFTNYHTAANCAPARAMLLTGVDNHLAGVPDIPETLPPELKAQAHYQGVLGDNVVTIATLLEASGYHTYLAGKWHLGAAPRQLPSRRGFERTVALIDSGADNFEQRPYMPIYDDANWFADGERLTLPEDFYSSEFLIDKTIEFIDSNLPDGKPFFAYVPFQAVHIPVQAPQEFIDRYEAVYDAGWDALRLARHARAIELGIVPERTALNRMSTTDDWASLSDERKRYEAKRMAVYAGMIEAMDHHIGRLTAHLKAQGVYDNTIFVFTSDNGGEASGSVDPTAFGGSFMPNSLGYSTEFETLGTKGSYNSISPSFASAAVSPLSFYKFYAGEGGMRVPLVIAGAPLALSPGMNNAFVWATDIAATILAFAETAPPGPRYAGKAVLPMTGKNLRPLLAGSVDQVYDASESVGYELSGHSALFQGDFKIVLNRPPRGDGQWHLFDIVKDPGETRDLREVMPAQFQSMLTAYERYAVDNKVLPMPEGHTVVGQIAINYVAAQLKNGFIIALLTLLVIAPFGAYVWGRRKPR